MERQKKGAQFIGSVLRPQVQRKSAQRFLSTTAAGHSTLRLKEPGLLGDRKCWVVGPTADGCYGGKTAGNSSQQLGQAAASMTMVVRCHLGRPREPVGSLGTPPVSPQTHLACEKKGTGSPWILVKVRCQMFCQTVP